MAVQFDPEQLAAMCFHRVPSDVVPRDVAIATLWHLTIRAVRVGSEIRTFSETLCQETSGLTPGAFRATARELSAVGLIFASTNNSYGLTPAGHRAVRGIVDVDRVIARERASSSA